MEYKDKNLEMARKFFEAHKNHNCGSESTVQSDGTWKSVFYCQTCNIETQYKECRQ